MRKSLELQAEIGPVFDITLDCEDGAPIGGEAEHVQLVLSMLHSANNLHGRVGARVHPPEHTAFEADVDELIRRGGEKLAYLMVPKPRHIADVNAACEFIDLTLKSHGIKKPLPVHVLVETHGALIDVQQIAAHPRVQSLSFGLMDFVSAHRGAIPGSAMGVPGQFTHPLVVRAKLEIAAAAHAFGKTPSHCVVTEFKDVAALKLSACRAANEFGYTRMWSIHPSQIQPIIEAFAPGSDEIEQAAEIIAAAQAAQWGPIRHRDTLHDRASYRYYWQLLERAHRTGQALGEHATKVWFSS